MMQDEHHSMCRSESGHCLLWLRSVASLDLNSTYSDSIWNAGLVSFTEESGGHYWGLEVANMRH